MEIVLRDFLDPLGAQAVDEAGELVACGTASLDVAGGGWGMWMNDPRMEAE